MKEFVEKVDLMTQPFEFNQENIGDNKEENLRSKSEVRH